MSDRRQRAIPDEFFPMAEQAMLNLALNGAQILVQGRDVSASLISQASRINDSYEKGLTKLRAKRAETKRNPVGKTATKKVTAKPSPPKMALPLQQT